jgi:hypothetical protein
MVTITKKIAYGCIYLFFALTTMIWAIIFINNQLDSDGFYASTQIQKQK